MNRTAILLLLIAALGLVGGCSSDTATAPAAPVAIDAETKDQLPLDPLPDGYTRDEVNDLWMAFYTCKGWIDYEVVVNYTAGYGMVTDAKSSLPVIVVVPQDPSKAAKTYIVSVPVDKASTGLPDGYAIFRTQGDLDVDTVRLLIPQVVIGQGVADAGWEASRLSKNGLGQPVPSDMCPVIVTANYTEYNYPGKDDVDDSATNRGMKDFDPGDTK